MDQLVAAVIGAILGFLMPYGAKVWERATRSRRMTSALKSELTEIVREMKGKEVMALVCLDDLKKIKTRLNNELTSM